MYRKSEGATTCAEYQGKNAKVRNQKYCPFPFIIVRHSQLFFTGASLLLSKLKKEQEGEICGRKRQHGRCIRHWSSCAVERPLPLCFTSSPSTGNKPIHSRAHLNALPGSATGTVTEIIRRKLWINCYWKPNLSWQLLMKNWELLSHQNWMNTSL